MSLPEMANYLERLMCGKDLCVQESAIVEDRN